MSTLRRDRSHGWLGGVCAGLAEQFDISVTVVRLAFLLTVLLGHPEMTGFGEVLGEPCVGPTARRSAHRVEHLAGLLFQLGGPVMQVELVDLQAGGAQMVVELVERGRTRYGDRRIRVDGLGLDQRDAPSAVEDMERFPLDP